MHVGANGLGWVRRVAEASASLIVLKAVMAASVHSSVRSFPCGVVSRLLRGPRMEAQCGMKRWWKLTSPKNSRSFRSDVGLGKSVIALTFSLDGVIPWALTVWPRNSSSAAPNLHLEGLIMMPCSERRWKTCLRCCWCSPGDELATRRSSM